MRILLIDPPFYRFMGLENRYFPIGLGYIASCLQNEGHEVKIYSVDSGSEVNPPDYNRMHQYYKQYRITINDNNHPVWIEIIKVIKEFKPEVIGLTAMTPKIASVLRTATLIKEFSDNIKVIIGGPHATIKPDELLHHKGIDYIIRGEGEINTIELIKNLEKNNKRGIEQIEGLSYRKDGEVFHNPLGVTWNNIDSLPFPSRESLLNAEHFLPEDLAIIMTSRGCPFGCTFCYKEMFGKRVRFRSIDNVISEIKYVIKRYKAKQFAFKDDSFTLNRKRVVEFCDKIQEEKIKINWECTTRVDLIDEDLLNRMVAAGCNMIKVGVESGSDRILRLINKGISLEEIKEKAKIFNKKGISWTAYFMIGIPYETEEDILNTLQFMKTINPSYASIGIYEAYPGTELFEVGVKLGLVRENMPLSQYFEREPDDYFFQVPNKRVNTMSVEKFEELCELLFTEFDNYNKSFKRLMKMGFTRRKMYLANPKSLFRDLKRGLKWLNF